MSFCLDYDFEIDRVVEELSLRGAKRVLVQLPEGFQRCFSYISREIRKRLPTVSLFLSLNPSYGACLVDEHSALEIGADVVLHFGHEPYPFYSPRVPTIFIPVEYRGTDKNWLRKVLGSLREYVVYTTAQHLRTVDAVCKELGLPFGGIVLGCWMSEPSLPRIAVVSGGRVQCLAAQLMNPHSRVLCIDPYTQRIEEVEPKRVLRSRLWKVAKAFDAKKTLLIDGFYGQSRKSVIEKIVSAAERAGVSVVVAKVLKLDEATLRNIGVTNFDAIVVASCPRLAVDDLSHLEVPVLTPGEALAALERDLERYSYPW